MNIEVSEVIDRSPEVVFQFVGVEHIRNHPRWDTKMELAQLSDGPMAVGTRVRRRHTRAGYPIDGMMECVEFDPPRAIGWAVHEGQVDMYGRMTIESEGVTASRVTISVEIPGAPNPLDPLPVAESLHRIKELIETER